MNVIADVRTLRETDLLAFEIAVKIGEPAAVMCAYNKVNGDYSCENDYLLNQVLKKEWGFKGFVLSDWGGTHSTVKAALNGLDHEEADATYFGAPLKAAVERGEVPVSRLDDMVQRILRSMFANGVIDHPPVRRVVDPFLGREEAQRIAEASIVLLKNEKSQLPLPANVGSIVLIGSHADVGVLSGGGSAQVDSPGGNAIDPQPGVSKWQTPIYFPSSPLKALRAMAPQTRIDYLSGDDRAAALTAARNADIAIVFANQYTTEGDDVPLSLPDQQDDLIAAIAAVNSHTVVILETGGPVSMPWLGNVNAVLAAWYPGIGGAEALANVLFGRVNPSAKLPITFPRSESDLPSPVIQGTAPAASNEDPTTEAARRRRQQPFDVQLVEGRAVGYRWCMAQKREPLFAFGHGLSYTQFEYSDLKVEPLQRTASFTIRNSGTRAGAEIAQVYVGLPAAARESFLRLAGWRKVELAPGEARTVSVEIDPKYISIFDTKANAWRLLKGNYRFSAGRSSIDMPLTLVAHLK